MVGDNRSATELRQLLTEALSRFGVAGRVETDGITATLTGYGPTATVDVRALIAEWENLPDDARMRRAARVARDLVANRRSISGSLIPAKPRRSRALVTPFLVFLAAGLAAFAIYQYAEDAPATSTSSGAKPASSNDYEAYERERAERAERVCETTRARVARGAPIVPTDVEGWVVELDVLRSPARGSPLRDQALDAFITRPQKNGNGRVVWPGSPAIANLDGPDTAATLVDSSIPNPDHPVFSGLRILFTGRYVVPYFDELARPEFLRLAKALAEALAVDYGALYARCAMGRAHHVGSWFRGPTPAGAVTALLYYMGTSGDVPDVRKDLLVPLGSTELDSAFAFQNVEHAAASLDKAKVMDLLRPEEGSIAGLDGAPSTIGFPFRDPNRASRTSHEVARTLSLGDEH